MAVIRELIRQKDNRERVIESEGADTFAALFVHLLSGEGGSSLGEPVAADASRLFAERDIRWGKGLVRDDDKRGESTVTMLAGG